MPQPLQLPHWQSGVPTLTQLGDILPWYAHNALVHYLSPRGLEQYSGGGWGTRDVCQGPLEMLLALGQTAPVRDLLLRVFSAQNPDGDWPQWFMFFPREASIRAGDSHGDIVFWPLLGLAQYLIASGDASVLDSILDDATTLRRKLGHGDQAKLDDLIVELKTVAEVVWLDDVRKTIGLADKLGLS